MASTKKRKNRIIMCIMAFCMLLSFGILAALPVQGAEDVPTEVINAKSGVVRIIASPNSGDWASMGSGFAVGKEGSRNVNIVTNYHVVEDADQFYVFYNTGQYVSASVVYEDRERDIAVLRPSQAIPGIEPIQLETDNIQSGAAVYALGFPGAADYFVEGEETGYYSLDEYLSGVIADKNSMSITDGIISAMHNSVLIGNGSIPVLTIQTNTDINDGNSGGPLLNRAGRVVGINTMGLTIADGMNGSVHTDELIKVLLQQNIEYDGSPAQQVDSTPNAQATQPGAGTQGTTGTQVVPAAVDNTGIIIVMVIAVLAVIIALITLIMVARRRRTSSVDEDSLLAFERNYGRVDEYTACYMAKELVQKLIPLSSYDLNPLMDPENILIEGNSLLLKNEGSDAPAGAQLDIFPGYSAPENYKQGAGSAATVYFIGAVMYTLTVGGRPPEALSRKEENSPVFKNPTTFQSIVNAAMEPYEQNRIQNLYALYDVLQANINAIYAESAPKTYVANQYGR